MSKGIFITGTGTDIGKTYVTGLIVKKLASAGKNAAYYKAAMSGNIRDEEGNLIPGDAKFVKDISGIKQPLDSMCPYVYESAVSPHLASRLEGNPVRMEKVKESYKKLLDQYDFITVEGSGGIICPIDFDLEKTNMESVIKALDLSCIIIADAGLGTINNLVLTYEYMKSHGITAKGVIYNHYHKGNVMEEDNIFMCNYLTGLETLAKVADDDDEIEIDLETLISLYD